MQIDVGTATALASGVSALTLALTKVFERWFNSRERMAKHAETEEGHKWRLVEKHAHTGDRPHV